MHQMGQHDEALALYQRAIVVAPENRHALIQLARMEDGLGQHEEAAIMWDNALRLERDFAALSGSSANAFSRGKPEMAQALLDEADSLKPDHPKSILLASKFSSKSGKQARHLTSRNSVHHILLPMLSRLKRQRSRARVAFRSDRDVRPKISLICLIHRTGDLKNAAMQLARQSYQDLEILVFFHNSTISEEDFLQYWHKDHRPEFFRLDTDLPLALCRNTAIEKASGEIVIFFDADDIYFPHYVSDMARTLEESGCDIVAKYSIFIYLESIDVLMLRSPHSCNRPGDQLKVPGGSTLCCHKAVFEKVRFSSELTHGEDASFYRAVISEGFRVFYPDPFNHVVIRKSDKNSHTWKMSDEDLVSETDVIIGRRKHIRYACV
jgi:hypothetical protein